MDPDPAAEDLRAFRKSARAFAKREIAPLVLEAESNQRTPREIFERAGRAGFLGLRFPHEVGGGGAGSLAEAIAREEFAAISSGIASALSVSSHLAAIPIHAAGRTQLTERYLRPLFSGHKVGAFALTEPDAGSDVRAIKTKAVQVNNDGWIITGRKTLITNAPIADVVLVVARLPDEGMGVFAVDLPNESVTVTRMQKMGNLSSEVGEVELRQAFVPNECAFVDEGQLGRTMTALNAGRIAVAAGALGVARSALDLAVDYAKQRVAFGNVIGTYQAVSFPLAEAFALIRAARLTVYEAARRLDSGIEASTDVAIAKLIASETVLTVVDRAIRVFGGSGYIVGSPIERFYRDARYYTIVEGTSEMHKKKIAKDLGLGSTAASGE